MIPTPPPAAPLEIQPDAGSRLALLHAMYVERKAAADAAAKELKAVTDGIKLELTQLATNAEGAVEPKVRLAGDNGPALVLSWVVSNRLDTDRIKTELPAVYAQFTKASGAWQLRPAKAGE